MGREFVNVGRLVDCCEWRDGGDGGLGFYGFSSAWKRSQGMGEEGVDPVFGGKNSWVSRVVVTKKN